MRFPGTSRLLAVLAVVGVACSATGDTVAPTAPPAASASRAATSPAPTDEAIAPTPAPTTADTSTPAGDPAQVVGDAVDVGLGDAASVRVHGAYPRVESSCRRFRQPTFDGRYPGDLRIEREDGRTLRVVVTVPFGAYLRGIAEVPPTWPAAALEAQAIAARSYALSRIGFTGPDGAAVDTPICATDACQVYRGLPLERTPGIGRWYAAVDRTAGRALVWQGRPADAVYFSTSNGRTYGNDVVFGGSPLPYLRGIKERDDGASATSRWRVTLRHDHLETFLRARSLWDGGRIDRVVRRDGVVDVRGPGGARSIDESTFRTAVNGAAPCLMPGRYPGDSRFGSRLPLTIPSRWYRTLPAANSVTLEGRGWGHGVGMVQWGAHGKARRGWSAGDILAAYYGGVRSRAFPEPGMIRVLVAEGLRRITIDPERGSASIGGTTIDRGTSVVVAAGGEGLEVRTRSRAGS